MGRKGGDSSNIEIFLRVKPTNRPAPYFNYDLAESKVSVSNATPMYEMYSIAVSHTCIDMHP